MDYNLTVINKNNEMYIDSREIATMLEKKHSHLCRDIAGYIKVIDKNPNLDSSSYFIESTYKQSGNGKAVRCFLVTHQGCDMIANKLTGEKGIAFTAVYVDKFSKMQKQLQFMQLDSYMIEDPIIRAEKWMEEKRTTLKLAETVKEQAEQLELQEPAVEYCQRTSENDFWFDISTAAKKLNIKGLGQRNLMKFLRNIGDFMYKKINGKKVNVPAQYGVDKGYYRLYSYTLEKENNPNAPKTVFKPQITEKGMQHIIRIAKKHPELI